MIGLVIHLLSDAATVLSIFSVPSPALCQRSPATAQWRWRNWIWARSSHLPTSLSWEKAESGSVPKPLWCRVCSLSCVWLVATPWTEVRQAPLSLWFPSQEYWNGLLFPPPGDLPNPGIEPVSVASLALAGGFFTPVPPGKPLYKPSLNACHVAGVVLELSNKEKSWFLSTWTFQSGGGKR